MRVRVSTVLQFVLVLALVTATALIGVVPVAAQSADGPSDDDAAENRRCFPDGGHELTIGDGNPHIDVSVHTSLFTSAPPSALGLAARGVALDSDLIRLRTGVVFDGVPSDVSTEAVWDAFAILFDYQFSLPMFAGSIDDSTYEPTGGPVTGVETRGC